MLDDRERIIDRFIELEVALGKLVGFSRTASCSELLTPGRKQFDLK